MEMEQNQSTHHGEAEIDQVEALLTELRLKHWGFTLKNDLVEMPPAEKTLILKHISRWASTEKAERKAALISSRIRTAKFKRLQTIDTFDFSHSKATQTIQKNYLSLYNTITPKNLPSAVFTGNAGLGKTHLARALGFAACQQGISVLFLTAAEMVNQLSHAQRVFNLESELNRYRRPQVLIIDELGYVSLDAQASNLFFQVISARHDLELGTIATTNIPFGKFNQIFANDAIAHAIVDRLVNDAEIFFMEGTSYREYQRDQKQKKTGQISPSN
ncbi:MAG: ATP-binding protein [Deltaproteobacteria bacterium]|nr:ATP-binding protein [Deltaproteobacteria bacterium]